MKKTIRTVLTAAMFATANLSAIPGSAAGETNTQPEQPSARGVLTEIAQKYAPKSGNDQPETIQTEPTFTDRIVTATTTTQPAPLYGPPWVFTSKETLPVSTTTEVTTTIPQLLYGAPLFYKMLGDVNLDQRVDNFDVIKLRRMLTTGIAGSAAASDYADINRDGRVSIADLLMLQRYILGDIKELYNTKNENGAPFEWINDKYIEKITSTTTVPDVNTTTTTVYDPRNDIIVTLYGVAPIRDVVMDIHDDIESGVDTIEENSTSPQEK